MNETTPLGSWVKRFLQEHVRQERNLSLETQHSYRDGFVLLLPWLAKQRRTTVDKLNLEDVCASRIHAFLGYLAQDRGCGAATCNQRLATFHAWAGFVSERSPVHVGWAGEIRAIAFKKIHQPTMPYLEKAEMDALLEIPPRESRDYALLLFLLNSGARASEACQLTVGDLDWGVPAVTLHGKGNKDRRCPLWAETSRALRILVAQRAPTERVFLNRQGEPLTRFGLHKLVERYALQAAQKVPSLKHKRVSPHTLRHTTAMFLLRAGVDLNTIRGWLGHASLDTVHIYAECDLDMKAKALKKCELPKTKKSPRDWRSQPQLLDFLRSL